MGSVTAPLFIKKIHIKTYKVNYTYDIIRQGIKAYYPNIITSYYDNRITA